MSPFSALSSAPREGVLLKENFSIVPTPSFRVLAQQFAQRKKQTITHIAPYFFPRELTSFAVENEEVQA